MNNDQNNGSDDRDSIDSQADDCWTIGPHPDWALVAHTVTYRVCFPVLSLLALAGNSVWLRVFCLQLRAEKAFWYHVFAVVNAQLRVLATGLQFACTALYGIPGLERQDAAAVWFRSQYCLMWYRAHLGSLLVNGCLTSYLFLSVCIAADQLFAISQPIRYRHVDHSKLQSGLFVLGLLLGLTTGAYDCFRWRVVPIDANSRYYRIVLDRLYVASFVAVMLNHFRTMIRSLLLLCSLGSTVALVMLYRRRLRSAVASQRRNSNQWKIERSLISFVICRSLMSSLSAVNVVVGYSVAYSSPETFLCRHPASASIADGLGMLFLYFEFYVLLLVSSQFRSLVAASLRCNNARAGQSLNFPPPTSGMVRDPSVTSIDYRTGDTNV